MTNLNTNETKVVGDIVTLVDNGSGVPTLPAVDASLLINAPRTGPIPSDGEDGDIGPPGPPGTPGLPGASGMPIPGQDGEDGDIGPPGTPGATGAPGAAGMPIPGQDGEDGDIGPPGQAGQQGTQGLQGRPGVDGDDGLDGERGPPGAVGATGPAGPALFMLNDADGVDSEIMIGIPSVKPFQNAFTEITVDTTTTSATYVDLLTSTIQVTSGNVLIYFTAAVSVSSTGSTPVIDFQLTVDGTAKRGGGTVPSANGAKGPFAIALVYKATGLSVGSHTFKIQWETSANTAQIRPVTTINEHGSLLITEVAV